tara:strand:- start:3567 stop:4406 length:840 start_codon:yes stop_codon:yes gene_type:complete
MANSLSQQFVKQFEAEVHHIYQAERKLAGTIRTRTGVNSSTVQFPKLASAQAQVVVPQSQVSALNVTHSNVTATLTDYAAPEYTSMFDQAKVNFDERSELTQTLGKAIGRRADQIVLDALAASSTSLTVANSIGGSNTNINVAKVLEAARLMNGKSVPSADRYMAISADGLSSLLSEEKAASQDYTVHKAMTDGRIDSFLGFKIIMIGDMDEGGLAIDGSSDRTCFAWHKDSVGYAEGISPKTEINYVAERMSWLTNCVLSAGAVAIDATGIVQLTSRE